MVGLISCNFYLFIYGFHVFGSNLELICFCHSLVFMFMFFENPFVLVVFVFVIGALRWAC
jgi:hypothetical protein